MDRKLVSSTLLRHSLTMNYRLATLEDLPRLSESRWDHWVEDGELQAQLSRLEFSETFTRWLQPRLGVDWFVWCAMDSDQIVCQVYIHRIAKLPKPSSPTDAFGYVTSVYTKPNFRNQGVGRALLNEVQRWALSVDLEFLVLWPSDESVRFWQREQFIANDSLMYKVRPYVN